MPVVVVCRFHGDLEPIGALAYGVNNTTQLLRWRVSWGPHTKRNFKDGKELCLLVGGSARARHEER